MRATSESYLALACLIPVQRTVSCWSDGASYVFCDSLEGDLGFRVL